MSAFDGAKSFLATTTLNTFIDEHTCNLATLTEYTTIGDAMKILAEKHIMSSPVLDEDGEYSGCVSVGDILKGATKDFVEAFGPHYSETISQIDAAKLTEVGEDFTGKAVRAILHDGDLWLKGDPTTSVLDVVMNGFNIQERQVHHRIYVCDPAKKQHIVSKDRTTVVNIEPGSEKLQASGWKPTDVVSQLDVVIALADNKDILADVVGQSLESIEAFMGTEATVAGNVTALEAFHHMAEDHKSTLGITDASGKLVGNLSVSDLRYLPSNAFGLLLRPVAEYVALVHGKEATLADAVAGARVKGAEQGDWATVLAGSPMVLLKPSTTFGEMLDAFKQNRAHRVHIVDDEGKPLSIITLTDVLRLVTKTPKPEQVPVTVGADEDMEDDAE